MFGEEKKRARGGETKLILIKFYLGLGNNTKDRTIGPGGGGKVGIYPSANKQKKKRGDIQLQLGSFRMHNRRAPKGGAFFKGEMDNPP